MWPPPFGAAGAWTARGPSSCRSARGAPLFSLEWRLDEFAQYATWFASPHTGGADDRIAFGGLLEELERDDLRGPAGSYRQ